MQAFLHSDPCRNIHPIAAAFACAGPVKNHHCEFTNLGWVVDADDVATSFNIHSTVLNDFEAVGYGITALPSSSIVTLHDAKPQQHGPIAVLGPGTGLGEAQLFYNDQTESYMVQPSEGSHATFAPRGDVQRALQKHIEEELGHCEVEHVACGSGLVRIYNFLHQYRHTSNNNNNNNNITPADVSKAALLGKDPIASEALDIMLAIVGAEAGHMALRALSSGGVYICGGVFPKVLNRVISGGAVKDGFLWKESRFYEKILKNVPLYVVTEENVGLIGAREQAAMLVKRDRGDGGVVMSG
jgi:glucokinase